MLFVKSDTIYLLLEVQALFNDRTDLIISLHACVKEPALRVSQFVLLTVI